MAAATKSVRSKCRILERKKAIVFGAGGTIGAAVAKEFAAEGAQVFLVGRTKSNLERVAAQIAESDGAAQYMWWTASMMAPSTSTSTPS